MPRSPHARGVDATTAAVGVDAFHHEIEILLPLIDDVVSEQNLRPAWSVRLDFRIAGITLYSLLAAEDHAAVTGVQQGVPHVTAAAGIKRDCRLESPPPRTSRTCDRGSTARNC